MTDLALLIDFGSTFTKVSLVDLATARLLGRAQSPSTVSTDVAEGLLRALQDLQARPRSPLAGRISDVASALSGAVVLASSSAAGGLRMAVIGNVPGLTLAAGNATALGAGAKVVGAFGFRLSDARLERLAALAADMILLTGGANGGDTGAILHNAAKLAAAGFGAPIVVAGNADATSAVSSILSTAGASFVCADNVMPEVGILAPEPARRAIQRIFLDRIVQTKGLERLRPLLPSILPTPMAVFQAAQLIADGCEERAGHGELLVVDIGGATTDVHSIGFGRRSDEDIVPGGAREPYAKRTVEGDLGVRINAETIVERVGRDRFVETFRSLFPEFDIDPADVFDYVGLIGRYTDGVPEHAWQSAVDATLARVAADIAIERHVGRRERYLARGGAMYVRSGKDMSEAGLLIGTGGIFARNPYSDRILHCDSVETEGRRALRPLNARILIDADYVLYAVGHLANVRPPVALEIFERHFGMTGAGKPQALAADIDHGEGCDCCSDWGGPSQWRLGRRGRTRREG